MVGFSRGYAGGQRFAVPGMRLPLGLHIWPLLPLVTAIRMAVRQTKSTEQAVIDDESFSQSASTEA